MATPEGYVRSPEDEALMARVRAEAAQEQEAFDKRFEESEKLRKEKEELENRIEKINERLRELNPPF